MSVIASGLFCALSIMSPLIFHLERIEIDEVDPSILLAFGGSKQTGR